MSSKKPVLAFFGATGGCANSALALALKDGYKAVALARTPKKLIDQLTTQHSIPSSTLDSNLTIVKGSAKDISVVKEVLSRNIGIIISGLGGTGKLQFSFKMISLDDPNICEDCTNVILQALRELQSEGKLTTKPIFLSISSTGISKRLDVPLLMYPFYHFLLLVPHADKKAMEVTLAKATTETNSPIGGFVLIRPTWLTNGVAKGKEHVRVGWERHPDAIHSKDAGTDPAKGYSISRADVGQFIFESVITENGQWTNHCVTLTY